MFASGELKKFCYILIISRFGDYMIKSVSNQGFRFEYADYKDFRNVGSTACL